MQSKCYVCAFYGIGPMIEGLDERDGENEENLIYSSNVISSSSSKDKKRKHILDKEVLLLLFKSYFNFETE